MKIANLFGMLSALILLAACEFQSPGKPSTSPAPQTPTPPSSPIKPQTDDSPLNADFDTLVNKSTTDYKVPGIAIGVIRGKEDLLLKGYGFSNLNSRTPVSADTLFAIGSMSKAFTSAAAGILVDRGQLSFDDKVISLLPDFQLKDTDATQNATLRQLLSHQSGLPRHDLLWYSSSFSRKEIYDRLRFLDPTAKLGEKFQYNNLMYLVAGLAVAAKAKAPWETVIQNEIFKPLGMTASRPTPLGLEKLSDVSAAHDYDPVSKTVFNIPIRNTYNIAPAGGIHSNVRDLAKWMRFQMGTADGLKLSSATLAELHKPLVHMKTEIDPSTPELSPVDYAMGWMSFTYRGVDVLAHGGSIDGFLSNILLVPSKEIGIVVLQNSRHIDLTNVLTFEALDRLLGVDHQGWVERFDPKLRKALERPETVSFPKVVPAHDWTTYQGSFTHPAYGTLQIVPQQDQGRIVLRLNQIYLTAIPYLKDTFVYPGAKPDSLANQISFEIDPATGKVVGVSALLEPTVAAIRFTPEVKTDDPLPPLVPFLHDAGVFISTESIRGLLGR